MDPSQLQSSCRAALAFLASQVRADRYWLDGIASDGSDCPTHRRGEVFSSYFIASAAGRRIPADIRALLIRRIRREERGGVWGYDDQAPVDSDDTAFSVRALRLLGATHNQVGVLSFRHPGTGLFVTFKGRPSEGRIALRFSPHNNYEVHSDVTANVYSLLWECGLSRYINWDCVMACQTREGHWRTFYYPSPYYSTFAYLRLLRSANMLGANRSLGAWYVRATQNSDGSWGSPGNAYETAMAIAALDQEDASTQVEAGMRALLAFQNANGSWSTSLPIWRFPVSGSVIWAAYDRNCVVTTSLALKELAKAAATERRGG